MDQALGQATHIPSRIYLDKAFNLTFAHFFFISIIILTVFLMVFFITVLIYRLCALRRKIVPSHMSDQMDDLDKSMETLPEDILLI